MFQRLKRIFGRKDAFGYTDGERAIFHFHDGRFWHRADPLAVERSLLTDDGWEPRTDPGVAKIPTVEGVKAAGRIVGAVRRAFHVAAFDAGGPTDAECLSLYAKFEAWLAKLVEDSRPLPSSPTPSPASASAASLTATSAASGSPASASAKSDAHPDR